jgi:hypothetical protein
MRAVDADITNSFYDELRRYRGVGSLPRMGARAVSGSGVNFRSG